VHNSKVILCSLEDLVLLLGFVTTIVVNNAVKKGWQKGVEHILSNKVHLACTTYNSIYDSEEYQILLLGFITTGGVVCNADKGGLSKLYSFNS